MPSILKPNYCFMRKCVLSLKQSIYKQLLVTIHRYDMVYALIKRWILYKMLNMGNQITLKITTFESESSVGVFHREWILSL